MRLITCHKGQLRELASAALPGDGGRAFVTGLAGIDALLPGGGLAGAAVHEILSPAGEGLAVTFALLVAGAAMGKTNSNAGVRGVIVWSDPGRTLHAPGLAAAGTPLEALYLIRPTTGADEVWAVGECLRCKGVAAVIAAPPRLTRIQARRLQLAAEAGGGVGILLRPAGAEVYAAATRWLVEPARGERTIQRWKVQLIHGHGGRLGRPVFLEKHRETNTLRAVEQLADRPGEERRREKLRA
jgi:protein ImuA